MDWRKSCTVQVEQFEGALELLLRLVQEKEIAVEGLSLSQLASQCVAWWQEAATTSVEAGAEGVAMLSQLIWLKSRSLLPSVDEGEIALEEFGSPMALIPKILEYCRFKEIAKELSHLEETGGSRNLRTAPPGSDWRPPLGIEHLSLNELATLFQQVIARAETTYQEIREEECKLSDSIKWLRIQLLDKKSLDLMGLFRSYRSRLQMIVLFLAILELMKNEELCVERDVLTGIIRLRGNEAWSG